jgi:hypothetical protein
MKLVFTLVVLINNVPSSEGMYFNSAEACNTMAFQTETGYAGSGPDGSTKQWKSAGTNIRAYCKPVMVEKTARVF